MLRRLSSLIYLDVGTHLIPHRLDCPPAEVSNEALLFGVRWPAIELGKSNGVSRVALLCALMYAEPGHC